MQVMLFERVEPQTSLMQGGQEAGDTVSAAEKAALLDDVVAIMSAPAAAKKESKAAVPASSTGLANRGKPPAAPDTASNQVKSNRLSFSVQDTR